MSHPSHGGCPAVFPSMLSAWGFLLVLLGPQSRLVLLVAFYGLRSVVLGPQSRIVLLVAFYRLRSVVLGGFGTPAGV